MSYTWNEGGVKCMEDGEGVFYLPMNMDSHVGEALCMETVNDRIILAF